MSTENPNPTIKGRVTLAQHHLPALEAGEYEVTVTQEVRGIPGGAHGKKAEETFETSAAFAVRGERFRLPPGDLHSVFPPENGEGDYSRCLPHVVFTRRTLPWERAPGARVQGSGEVPAWLALLLFDEGEGEPPFDLKPKVVTATDFFKGPRLGQGVSYFEGVPAGRPPEECLDFGEKLTDSCLALDVPLARFRTVAPSLDDLKLLAHARTVSLENQEQGLAELIAAEKESPANLTPEEDFSIVFGNRLPPRGRRCSVHLVSLEGLADHLPGGSLSTRAVRDGEFIRLAVLKSWSFTASGAGTDRNLFVEKLKGLNRDGAGNTLRLPVKETDAGDAEARTQTATALTLGYTALNHDLRGGGRTVSWYRGAFIPYAKRGRVVEGPVTSPDAATRFDPDTGLFDVSYAAAWQLGRLVALQDKAFSSALYLWKRKYESQLAARIAERIAAGFLAPISGANEDRLGGVIDLIDRTLERQPVASLKEKKP